MANGAGKNYDTPTKNSWRPAFYSMIIRALPQGLTPRLAVLACIDDTQGLEVAEALRHGFRERNIIVINDSAGRVAALRRMYPRLLDTVGVDFGRLGEKLLRPCVDVVSLDVTSCLSRGLGDSLYQLAGSHVLRTPLVLGFNFLRGRERELGGTELLDVHRETRFIEPFAARDWLVYPQGGDKYVSACGQSFLWRVCVCERQKKGKEDELVKLLTVPDVANVLSIAERRVWTLIKSGEIPRIRIGRSVRVRPKDLVEWINRRVPDNGA